MPCHGYRWTATSDVPSSRIWLPGSWLKSWALSRGVISMGDVAILGWSAMHVLPGTEVDGSGRGRCMLRMDRNTHSRYVDRVMGIEPAQLAWKAWEPEPDSPTASAARRKVDCPVAANGESSDLLLCVER
jgi:hypothetical protein